MRRRKKGATSRRYSEAFKQAVVVEVQSGRTTIGEVRRRYGIKGAMTVAGWLRRYGRTLVKPLRRATTKNVKTKMPAERLQRENRELRTALAQVTMEKVLLESLIQESEERLGVELRKNFGLRR